MNRLAQPLPPFAVGACPGASRAPWGIQPPQPPYPPPQPPEHPRPRCSHLIQPFGDITHPAALNLLHRPAQVIKTSGTAGQLPALAVPPELQPPRLRCPAEHPPLILRHPPRAPFNAPQLRLRILHPLQRNFQIGHQITRTTSHRQYTRTPPNPRPSSWLFATTFHRAPLISTWATFGIV